MALTLPLVLAACISGSPAPLAAGAGPVDVGPARRTWTGTLRTTWWTAGPGYGEHPEDPSYDAVVLVLDAPVPMSLAPARSSWSASGLALRFPDGPVDVQTATVDLPAAQIAGCLDRRVTLEAAATPSPATPVAGTWVALVDATLSEPCTEPDVPVATALSTGPGVTLTGTLSTRWSWGAPGFGADPTRDKVVHFASLELPAPLAVDGDATPWVAIMAAGDERARRATLACQGRAVSATGTLRHAKEPRFTTPILADATFTCAEPALWRGVDREPRPMPGWIEAAP